MLLIVKTAIFSEENHEFLGYIEQEGTSWRAQTLFGYVITRAATRQDAEAAVRAQGLRYLMGVWQYYDKQDGDWFPCVIKEAYEQKVVVVRTNFMGYQDPDDYKMVVIEQPDENVLIKSH